MLLLFVCGLIHICLSAQPGTPDYSFGDSGKVLNTKFTGDCRAVAVQKDGKIITAGEYESYTLDSTGLLVARFNANGSIDKSFGNAGKAIIRNIRKSQAISANSLAVQKDGKILICAHFITFSSQGPGDIGLVRLNKDGTPDESFGDSGMVVTSPGRNDMVGGMALQPDGKILVTGNKGVNANQISPAFIIRYLPNGKIDKSFGSDGMVYTQLTADFYSSAIKINDENKIIIGGVYKNLPHGYALLEYNGDGSLNDSFGVAGVTTLSLRPGNLYNLNDLAIQDDGNILITGSYGTALVLARFDKSGKIDSGFGKEHVGYVTVFSRTGYTDGKSVFAQKQNIIVTGINVNAPNTGFGAFSFDANGNVDPGFGNNGMAAAGFNVFALSPETGKGAIEPDGKIVVGGGVQIMQTDQVLHIALVKFNGDSISKENITTSKTNNISAAGKAITKINAYPNPVTNSLTVEGLDVKANYNLIILNDKGSVVATGRLRNAAFYQFNVQHLSSGIYYINIIENNKMVGTLRFIKE